MNTKKTTKKAAKKAASKEGLTLYYADEKEGVIHSFRVREYGKSGEVKAEGMLPFFGFSTILDGNRIRMCGRTPEEAVEKTKASLERGIVRAKETFTDLKGRLTRFPGSMPVEEVKF